MIGRRPLATLAATLLLGAAPPAALAQSGAGDSQYQDPFGSQGQSQTQSRPPSQSSSSPSSSSQSTPTPTPQSTSPQGQPATPSTSSSASPSTGTAPAPAQGAAAGSTRVGQLPRTGFDVAPVAALGLVLLVAGLALARRAAHDRR